MRKKRALLVVEVSEDLRKRLKAYCEKEGLKIRAVVEKAIEAYLEERSKPAN
ncbi:MAG: hypothetical protein QW794_05245 [Thermosphaera sp.]